jgi:drug/metabolite transporter (DMT)-like permease
MLLAVAALLSAFLYALPLLERPRPLRSNVRAAAAMAGHFELFAVGLVAFLAFPFVAFPADPVADGAVVNLYVHVLGYALAFVATYASIEVGVRLPGSEAPI